MQRTEIKAETLKVSPNDQIQDYRRTTTKKPTRKSSSRKGIQPKEETLALYSQLQLNSEVQTSLNSIKKIKNIKKSKGPLIQCPINFRFFNGMQCYYANEPMLELGNATKASIKQKFEPWEAISGCETPNQYYVFVKDNNNNDKYLFKAKEQSTWCCRNCCLGKIREFVLYFKTIIPGDKAKSKKVDYAEFRRPYKCPCCHLNRPEMIGKIINDSLPGNIGKIIQDFTCCDPKIQIFDRKGKGTWSISCDCCQIGYLCSSTACGKCSEINFEIYHGVSKVKGKPSGTIRKSFKGLQSIFNDADFFEINFPEKATPEEKFLLISAVIMLDYMYFEDKDDSIQPGQHSVHNI